MQPPAHLVGEDGDSPTSLENVDLEAQPFIQMRAASTFVSPWLAAEFHLVAVDVCDAYLTLAVADTRGLEGSAIVRACTGLEVISVVAAPAAIVKAQECLYGDQLERELSNELRRLSDPPEDRVGDAMQIPTRTLRDTHADLAELRLGEKLLQNDQLSSAQLEIALQIQERTGSRIGDVLVHWDLASDNDVADALAEQSRTPRTNLLDLVPESAALNVLPKDAVKRLRVIPITLHGDTLHVAVDGPLGESTLSVIREYTSYPIWPIVGTRSEFDTLYSRTYAEQDERLAAEALLTRIPDESAFTVLILRQRYVLYGLLILLGVGVLISPLTTLVALNLLLTTIYVACSVYKFKLVYSALGHSLELPVNHEEVAALDDHALPTYTILVPLYREAIVVQHLVTAIANLDYPRSKLDIKLITEEDDPDTRAALAGMELPAHFKILTVPKGEPRTKPKACNFGLLQAEGEFVVIYDAEDRPEPDQLRKVIAAFSKADKEIVCIQCKLNFFNRDQNLLTRWFALEYSTWFDLLMPGLDAAGCPIPLGGTSNHLSRSRLIEMGAWDPFNVTEDCDLGVRLHKAGYKTAIVDSTTFEEANSELNNWIRQRSRWVKGYIQTWLVHMRHPVRLQRQIGWRSWCSLQLVLAGSFLTFLINPIFWVLNTAWISTHAGLIHEIFPASIYYVSILGLYVGNVSFVYVNVAGALRRHFPELVKYALISPLYWGLMSVGAWKGLLQLCTRPHYWEKTIHGLDQVSDSTR